MADFQPQFRRWTLKGSPSDFNLILLNREHVVTAKRVKHGDNGVEVSMLGWPCAFTLKEPFDEFAQWLATDTGRS